MQELPKTKEQKQFEDISKVIIKLLSELSQEERKQVFDYVLYMYNNKEV